MKKTAIILSCIIFTLLISCTQNRDEKRSVKEEGMTEKESIGSRKDGKIAEKEEFEQFLVKFSRDKSFQLNRIKFPINVIVPDLEHEGMAPMNETIGKYEWELLDLTYDSTFLTRPYDQYYQVVRYRNDIAVVEIRGIDNGIYADYYFELIDDRWYLVTLYEASF